MHHHRCFHRKRNFLLTWQQKQKCSQNSAVGFQRLRIRALREPFSYKRRARILRNLAGFLLVGWIGLWRVTSDLWGRKNCLRGRRKRCRDELSKARSTRAFTTCPASAATHSKWLDVRASERARARVTHPMVGRYQMSAWEMGASTGDFQKRSNEREGRRAGGRGRGDLGALLFG